MVVAKQESGKSTAWSVVGLESTKDEDFVLVESPSKHTLCDKEVDWETIAEYLSQCQSSGPVDAAASDRIRHDEAPHKAPPLQTILHSIFPTRYAVTKRESPTRTLTPRFPITTSPSPSASATPATNPGLSTGAKAGIVGGAAIGVVIILATLVTLHTRRRRKQFGYARTKGKDTMAAELDGHFVVTTWPEHGETSPMMKPVHTRRQSDGHIGLGLERLPERDDFHHEIEGRGVEYYDDQHIVSPDLPSSIRSPLANIYSPTPQSYQPSPILNHSPSPEREARREERHYQQTRRSHPLAQLSEAIPPSLGARRAHSMADYQTAVPLGFANGFVQVGHTERTPDTPTRTWDSIQPTYELDLGERFNHGRISEEADAERGLIQAAEEDRVEEEQAVDEETAMAVEEAVVRETERVREEAIERVEGDSELPQYEEMPAVKKQDDNVIKNRVAREHVRWNQATGHYHIDTDSEDEGQGTSRSVRRELTKEELG